MSKEKDDMFDKFMDSIVIKEQKNKKVDLDDSNLTSQQRYIKRYTERANNKIKIGGKTNA